jgi:hypothetical protein
MYSVLILLSLKLLDSRVSCRIFIKISSYSNISPSLLHVSSGRKVEDPDMLERIRLTIINNLLQYHPVCFRFLCVLVVTLHLYCFTYF